LRGSTQGLEDVEEFLRSLSGSPEAGNLLRHDTDTFVARAPGRLDVMGGIADYSGSLVLQLPIEQAAFAAVQRSDTENIEVVSLGNQQNGRQSCTFSMPFAQFYSNANLAPYSRAHDYFQSHTEQHWAAYIAGTALVLRHECGARLRGLRIVLNSNVPEGKGVSSSAAIEVATMQAICAACDIGLDPRTLALLCQKVENLIVGAPCGVMDQMTAACGEKDRLLRLLCQPADLQGAVAVPDESTFWGIDSGIRHSVSGSDYSSVRVGAFMGYRILAELAGLPVRVSPDTREVEISDPRWKGYLANLSPSEFEHYQEQIPTTLSGSNFLEKYHGTTDSVTQIDPQRTYAVRQPTGHPVYEHSRVQEFADLLAAPLNDERLTRLGELMFQSHASYSACGLGSTGTDLIVNLVRDSGTGKGLYGAKITGGGSGGTVAVLGKRGASQAVEDIARLYAHRTGHAPVVLTRSSPGAAVFGYLQLAL
jgi:L-arabinokinase